jgi:hypothetical protein
MSQTKAQLLSPNGNFGIGTDNPLSRLHVSGTHNSHIRMTNTSDDGLELIGDANRSNANTTILGIKGRWNGTEVSRIIFQTDADTTNKDDGNILFHTKSSGSSLSERLRITSDGNVNIGGEYSQTDSKVTIVDVSRPIAEATLNLQSSTTSGAADTGPVLRFYGHSGSEGRYHSSIKGAKENGTSGNTAGYLAFNTRPADGGAMAERLRITSGGNIGIGTDNPTAELHVSALGATDEPTIKISGENSSIFLRTAGSSGSFPTGGVGNDGELIYLGGDFRFGVGTASKNLIFFNGSGYTERLRITSDGNIGINTTDAPSKVTIGLVSSPSFNRGAVAIKAMATDANCGTSGIYIEESSTNSGQGEGYNITVNADGDLNFHNSGAAAPTVTFSDTDNVGIGETNPQTPLHITVPAGEFLAATIEKASSDDVAIELKNTQGNIFIGLDGGENFHVAAGADLNNSSNARFCITNVGEIGLMGTSNVGSNNQVLTSQGSGNPVTWRGVNAAFYGEQDTEHSITNTTWTVLKNFATSAINTTGWNESTGIFTANADTAGVYYVFGQGGIDDVQSVDYVRVGISKNNASPNVFSQSRNYSGGSNNVQPSNMVARVVSLADGDTVRLKIYHNEGTTENTEKNRCYFGGYRLSV